MKAFPSRFFRPFYLKTGSLHLAGRRVGGRWGEVDWGEKGRGEPPPELFGGSSVSLDLIGHCSG